jgi:uncharacterized Zn finger protein
MSWYRYDYFPRSRPRAAKGGIKAQSKRGAFGQSWWAKRWIAVLEGFNIGARLGRGRSYARNGQVLDIELDKGKVTAKVQGSQARPYAVTIQVKALTAAEWTKLIDALAGQALYSAKLLAGEMPQDIEEVFQTAKLSLFPERLKDLTTACSCPDSSNPCKHIAAVYYLIGEEFDRDPFLLFRLRGLDRDELLARLGSSEKKAIEGKQQPAPLEPATSPEPLPGDLAAFWSGSQFPDAASEAVNTPRGSAALPKRLGNFPFWRGSNHFLDTLEKIYAAAAPAGLDAFLGERRQG